MIVAALTVSVLAFVAVLRATGAVSIASAAAREARGASAILRSPVLSDLEKELRSRRAASRLFVAFLKIAGIGAVALAASFAIVWAGAASGFYALDDAVAVAGDWPFILGASAAATLAWLAADGFARARARR
jgi:hypothetical protein